MRQGYNLMYRLQRESVYREDTQDRDVIMEGEKFDERDRVIK